jgi:hypothetical protein
MFSADAMTFQIRDGFETLALGLEPDARAMEHHLVMAVDGPDAGERASAGDCEEHGRLMADFAGEGKSTPSISSADGQDRSLWVVQERSDRRRIVIDQSHHRRGVCVANPQPNHFWRRSTQKTELVKVPVLRQNGKTIAPGQRPNRGIRIRFHAKAGQMQRSRKPVLQKRFQPERQVFGDQQFCRHAAPTSLRSRSAANSRTA